MQILIDPKKFVGVHSVADAVEHLHSGKSLGKVCGLLALLPRCDILSVFKI